MNKQEGELSNLDRINNWISNCDTKSSFILTLLGVVVTIILTSDFILEKLNVIFQSIRDNKEWDITMISLKYCIVFIMFLVMLYYLSYSIYYLLNVLTANIDINSIDKGNEKLKRDSNMFFVTIASKQYDEFKEDSTTNISEDICSQIYINSHICTTKFSNYNKSIEKLKKGLVCFVIFILSLIIFM